MNTEIRDDVAEVARHFAFRGQVTDVQVCGNGHINSTFIIRCTDETGASRRYILQILNTAIFRHPEQVMENIVRVTGHIRAGMLKNGEDAERGVLHVVPLQDDPSAFGYTDEEGRFFRAYDFVEHTVCRLTVDSPETFFHVGEAFGDFQKRLSDFDASVLHETIPDFHHTKKRYEHFLQAVREDRAGRASSVAEEIAFISARANRCALIVDALESGEIPLRVTHNDTKLSNILLDETTGEAVCIIDLDTVMPGSVLYDFGDSIRSGATDAAEDEKDLDKVYFRPDMFRAYAEGFVKGTGGVLTGREISLLPEGGYIITLEQGIRFLTDYLEGDTYYHTEYADHNLVRTRTQLKLVSEMEKHERELREIVRSLA